MPDMPAGRQPPETGKVIVRKGLKRPLVLVVLAFMLGLATAAWGLRIPRLWLMGGLAGSLVFLILLYLWKSSPFQKDLDIHEE
uniref:Uncharacterized protein n=1 Tax=Desulfobacca acetoxidans TaxID=60893 RepID=A0A7C3Z164_9BACT